MCLSHNVIRRYKSYFNVLLCMHTMKWEDEGFWQRKEKQATLSKQQNTSHKRKKERRKEGQHLKIPVFESQHGVPQPEEHLKDLVCTKKELELQSVMSSAQTCLLQWCRVGHYNAV